MKFTRGYLIILLLGLTLLISGCGKDATVAADAPEVTEMPEVTEVPEATATPEPTKVPEPTEVPEATVTPELTEVPEPTATPEPTVTPEPTATPEPAEVPEQPEQEARLLQGFCVNPDKDGYLSNGMYMSEPIGSFWLKIDNGTVEIVRSNGDLSEFLLEEIKKLDIPDELPAWGEIYTIQEQDKNYNVILTVDIKEDMLPSFTIPEGWEYQFGAPRIGSFMGYEEGNASATPMADGNYFGYEDRLSDGCSTYCACWNSYMRGSVSSSLQPEKYGVYELFDKDRLDAWAEGVAGPGIGEVIEVIQLEHGGWVPIFSYNEMCIVNGYAKNETVWQENNRVKSMKLYFENEYMGTITLEDTMQPQYIDLSPVNMKVGNGCEANFRFEITEVYPGTKYDDTCISGLIVEYEGRSH